MFGLKMETFIVKLHFNSFLHINQKSSLTSCSWNTKWTRRLKLRGYEIFPVTFRWCYDCDWTPQSGVLMSRSDWNIHTEVTPVSSSCDHTVIYFSTRPIWSVSGDPRQPWREQRFSTHQPPQISRSFPSSPMLCSADRGQTFDAAKQHCVCGGHYMTLCNDLCPLHWLLYTHTCYLYSIFK